MIVWGGYNNGTITFLNTGGRYNPSTDGWTATSTTYAPTARTFHTAVWTGSEMIVWGGNNNNSNAFNTGGRYNPSTDSWTATSVANAPSRRVVPTAVWTGSEMIVWGGDGNVPSSRWLKTGGRYDPGMDTWTATSTTNAPSARFLHTAVWTGSQMIAWGGSSCSPCMYFNTGGRYCAQSGPLPTPTPTPTPFVWPSITPRPRPTFPPRPTYPPRPTRPPLPTPR